MRWVLYDFFYGLHSGIPLCRVLDFLHSQHIRKLWAVGAERKFECGLSGPTYGYVPCRLCAPLLKRGEKVPATICHCDDKKHLGCLIFKWIQERCLFADRHPAR